jgi:predicted MPP superfamily phosphohydrolase
MASPDDSLTTQGALKRGAAAAGLRFALYLAACWSVLAALTIGQPVATALVAILALYVTLPLVMFIRWRGWPFYPGRAFRLLVVRVVLYAQLLLPVVAAAGAIGLVLGAPFGAALASGRAAAATVLVLGGLLLLAGWVGSRSLVTREVEALVPGLPAQFEGFRIAQVSDLHIGPHTSRAFLRRVAGTIAAAEADIVAVTGDLVDDRHEDVDAYAAALGGLRAPLGVFVIAGNHDVYADWELVERRLRDTTDATVLVNRAHLLEREDAQLALVGIGDPAGRGRGWGRHVPHVAPDVERALATVPDAATVVAFAHNPVLWPQLAARGVALTLSGHTHWGQLALPRRGWSLASPFLEHAMGAHRLEDALLWIHPGTGYWGIPFRIGALPEVTTIVLRRGDAAGLTAGIARRAA